MTSAPVQAINEFTIGAEFWISSALMVAGVIVHFITKLAAMEEEGQSPRPGHYIRTHPYRIMTMLLTCEAAIFAFHEIGQLTYVTAFFTGYACQSVSDNLRKRAENRVKAIPDPNATEKKQP